MFMREAPAARATRGERNDARVQQAMNAVLLKLGWAGFTLRNVAQAGGVARQTVTDRYPTRIHMAKHAWNSTFGPPLHDALHTLLSAHQLTSPTTPTPPAQAWRNFSQPIPELRGALELLLQTPFEPELRSVVHATLGPESTRWTTHNTRTSSRQSATQRAYLIARALGLLALGSIHDLREVDFTPTEEAISESLKRPARANRIAIDLPPPLPIHSGKERLDALLSTTIHHISTHGYENASIDAICQDAHVTKGFLFHHYPSKQALFIDAARERQKAAIGGFIEWLKDLASRQGQARAEASFIRAALRPERQAFHRIASEELRLAIHESELAETFRESVQQVAKGALGDLNPITLGYAYSVRAVGEGIGLLTLLEPNAWELPFETILVPLQESITRAYLNPDAPVAPTPTAP